KKEEAPELSFLSNVPELSEAVNNLQNTWEKRRLQLEGTIVESKIIFDTLPDVIFMLDSSMRVVRTNNAAHAIFGAHLYRKTIDRIIVDNDEFIEAVKDTLYKSGYGRVLEVVIKDINDDKYFNVNIERFPIVSSGNIAAIIVMHDVTESKRTEKMFADFVANASHEIRTPLTSLIGFIETLQYAAKDDEEAKDYFLSIMSEQAERMSCLIKELLSLSNIERNVDSEPTDVIDITQVIQGVINQINWQLDEKKMTITNKIDEKLPTVTGDYNQLVQVFTNLIVNAIKYSHENSQITLLSSVVDEIPEDMHPRGMSKALVISVIDEGEGIEEEHLERLTERFYRVDRSRSRKVGGSGLGLSIVKHIMNRHKGLLRVKSKIGKGSEFKVYFPIK
ncbi:MAG: ATP-binding protein, partial [Rickettsiales bacterium]|nr:ATP-binding protein [Rickettsiales bacterium]